MLIGILPLEAYPCHSTSRELLATSLIVYSNDDMQQKCDNRTTEIHYHDMIVAYDYHKYHSDILISIKLNNLFTYSVLQLLYDWLTRLHFTLSIWLHIN